MHHVIALLIKIGFTVFLIGIVLLIILNEFNIAETAAVSLLIALFLYIFDLTIMPRIKNIYSVLADTVTVFLLLWFLGSWMGREPVEYYIGFAIVSVSLGVFEFFYHRFLLSRIFPKDEEGEQSRYGETRENTNKINE
ncbi:uncharacterized protein DUF2512 [Sinobaca qinghaiensis]|uniref:Uncharacterized protein DUF2512 n=1 Tax=Sinobaca qinghaiensis TaxID=342944 RepID=A0A419UWB2_9BACL|nr:DUF2512 family protein [Sinobaca qinghaiensis]RKD69424.1 uncharacterized protein DUF2512 [Sinobaca qinghaiensis]